MFFGLVTKHECDRRMDGQRDGHTDGQIYDSQDRASIAASRGKNYLQSANSVSWSLTSLFSTNMATTETKGQGWKVIRTQ